MGKVYGVEKEAVDDRIAKLSSLFDMTARQHEPIDSFHTVCVRKPLLLAH